MLACLEVPASVQAIYAQCKLRSAEDGLLPYVEENALSVTVKRLRDKLEEVPSKPRYLKTVYGIGYTWAVK